MHRRRQARGVQIPREGKDIMTEKQGEFVSTTSYKLIYVFEIHDHAHAGLLKIGDATVHTDATMDKLPPNCKTLNHAARERIKSYTNTAGVSYNLLHTELAVRQVAEDGVTRLESFRDHDVHAVLENSHIHKVRIGDTTGDEWYPVDLETARRAIEAYKRCRANLSGTAAKVRLPIVLRPEQIAAVEQTVEQFGKSNRMLWNCKMRYGKTLTALEVVRRMGFKRTIIMTHRPVVDKGWYEDFDKTFDASLGYRYGSKGTGATLDALLKSGDPFVYFASIQDLRGSKKVGGKFDKNDNVFRTIWDFVIVDEAHEGTQTTLGDETVKAVVKEGKGKTKFLALSGTPFNIITDYEESEVFTWDYVMEQQAKQDWWANHFGDSNPYEDLPELRIYTYDLGDVFGSARYAGDTDVAFNFREFFRTWTGDFKRDHADMPPTSMPGDFVHEGDVRSFLDLMCTPSETSQYPFATEEYRDMFRHTLWMVPGVREARALQRLMGDHPVFGSGAFRIVNVAGDGVHDDEEDREALTKVLNAIDKADALGNYTITLSCGRLTTGVTVKEWTAVLMLSGSYSTSAANYLQTIFRVQSPGQIDGKAKEVAYVFDFAPDRTLKMVAEAVKASAKPGKTTDHDRQQLGKFLNFCPVIAISGSEMTKYDTNTLLQQMKRAYADRVVRSGFEDQNLYSEELYRLTDGDLSAFERLKEIVGTSKATKPVNEVDVNRQGLSDEEYEQLKKVQKKPKKELTEEEKELLKKRQEAKKNRDNAISILRQVSTRMPMLIFGADTPYDKDITLEEFVAMVDDASWEEFMPKGVTKKMFRSFMRFYDEDVFIAAGHRIRDIAHRADGLEPTERVKRIAGLFAYFKNPDKETVLTPWRVVNMHMSDCLGGWDFFDETHLELLDEPRFVDRGEVTRRAFDCDDSRILEINSKTGLYPLYVTYTEYRYRAGDNERDMEPDAKRTLWLQTVSNNIFVVCKTPMAKTITHRTLLGYMSGKIRAHYFDDLIGTLKFKPKQFVDKVRRPKYWGMGGKVAIEFSAVVGNPPYQDMGGSGGDNDAPVYQRFVQSAELLEPAYVSMITPSRWFSGGRVSLLGPFREHMLNNRGLRKLYDYPNAREVFPDVEIKGGVSYFLIDRTTPGDCETHLFVDGEELVSIRDLSRHEILIRHPMAESIVDKVRSNTTEAVESIIASDTPFGIPTNPKTSKKTPFRVFDTRTPSHDLPVYYVEKLERKIAYVDRSQIKKNVQDIDKYKAMFPNTGGSGTDPNVLGKPLFAPAGSVCSQTFIYAPFDTAEEAQNFLKYYKTRFFRFLVSVLKITQHAMRHVYHYVPMQVFSSGSDIDWSKTTDELDALLCDKYGLTEEERSFIASRVDPME